MNFLKTAMGQKDQKENTQGQGSQNQGQASQGQDKPDYVDKAFEKVAQKAGYNVDANTRENITDQGREAFEKATGKHVPDKVSN